MSDPRWREARPSRPYGGEPGARPRGRDPGIPPGAPRPPQAAPRTPQAAPRIPAAGARTPRRDPGWGGRDSGAPGAGGSGRDPGPPGRRGGDPGADTQTRRMPAQPGADGSPRARATRTQPTGPQPTGTQPTGTRPAVTQPRGMRGAALGPGGPRDSRGRKYPPRPRGQGRVRRWGALQGGLGVCIIVASAAVGAIVTTAARSAPGMELGLFVVAGTVAAALAVRPRAGRMIFPVPILSYLVAALISGIVFDRTADSSTTALAVAAVQWVASGFFAMALATVLAVVIIAARWFLWRRGRPAPRGASRRPRRLVPPGPVPTERSPAKLAPPGPPGHRERAGKPQRNPGTPQASLVRVARGRAERPTAPGAPGAGPIRARALPAPGRARVAGANPTTSPAGRNGALGA